MAKDDLTQKLPNNDEDKITQPTLMAVFELVREVKESVDRLSAEVTHLSARVTEMAADMNSRFVGLGYKIDALNKSRLQTEADYSSLFDRVKELESKIT